MYRKDSESDPHRKIIYTALMKIKHKILKDFQYVAPDKKITILKSGSVIEEFIYRTKAETILLDRDVVNSNSEYFQPIDWKQDLLAFMKQTKVPQPAVIGKKIIPFLEDMFVVSAASQAASSDNEKELRQRIEELEGQGRQLEDRYKAKRRELDEAERNLESRLTQAEIEMEKKYRARLREVGEMESALQQKELEVARREKEIVNAPAQGPGLGAELELQSMQRQIQLKEIEAKKDAEVRLTEAQVELEKKYREKMLALMEQESDLEIRETRIQSRQQEYEKAVQKLNERERLAVEQMEQLSRKQEEVRDAEFALNQRERDLDRTTLQGTKDLDAKQREMNDRLQAKLADLDKREKDLDRKMEALSAKESTLYDEFGEKIKEYEAQYNEKLEELRRREREAALTDFQRVKNIERMVSDYYTAVPWYHNQMWEQKSKIEAIMEEFKKL